MEPAVVCELVAHDLTGSLAELGMEFDADPCAGFGCGEHGQCLAVNGFATCRCDEDFAAVSVDGELTCMEAKKTYGPEALLWSDGCGCSSRIDGQRTAGLAGLLLLAALPLLRRRR
jgi:MYXO-CTERM domain-containing protein